MLRGRLVWLKMLGRCIHIRRGGNIPFSWYLFLCRGLPPTYAEKPLVPDPWPNPQHTLLYPSRPQLPYTTTSMRNSFSYPAISTTSPLFKSSVHQWEAPVGGTRLTGNHLRPLTALQRTPFFLMLEPGLPLELEVIPGVVDDLVEHRGFLCTPPVVSELLLCLLPYVAPEHAG